MIIYMGSFPIVAGSQQAVREALATAREHALAEDGCHAYEFGFDVEDDTRVVFHELYDDRAAFDHHMQADHTRALFATLGDHLAGQAAGRMYEAEVAGRDGDG